MQIFSLNKTNSMRKAKVNINHEKLKVSSEILRALAHPLRLKILEFIDKNKTINVNKIYNSLKLEQSITSQHLRILRLAGLVHTKRDGKKVANAIKAINTFLDED